MKNDTGNYCQSISKEMIFTNVGNSKSNEPRKYVLNLSQRLDLKSSNKQNDYKLDYLLHMKKYKTTGQKQ